MRKICKDLKKFIIFIFTLSIICSNTSLVHGAEEGIYLKNAQILQKLGLFQGTGQGFELNRRSNRAEGAVMLVRLLGAEETALKEAKRKSHPFVDVPEWASPHIAYLYQEGLTKGISDTLFGSKNDITPAQYTTMLLRALGYNDQEGLYDLNTALDFAYEIHMLNDEERYILKAIGNVGLLRDYMVMLSYNCLYTNIKDRDVSLLSALSNERIVEVEDEKAIIDETRGVWISYLDLQGVLTNKSEEEFKASIKAMFQNIKNASLNTVIAQVRPFGDALYPSGYFPWSYIISGTEGVAPNFDPLQIMVDEAHKQGLKFEAWINPYRIRNNTKPLSADNQAFTWLADGSNRVIKISSGIYYNPASRDVRELITKGVMEIVKNYDVDGIHFDDYFYPTTDPKFDQADYEIYRQSGGILGLADWRRENVNQLVRSVYSSIKAYDSTVQFGISPQGVIEKNYNTQYIDIYKWLSSSGYIDYICPQIYFGYNHSGYPYGQTVEQWNQLIKNEDIKLYVGLAAYKLGREDAWAGDGKTEWIGTTNILGRMIEDGRQSSHYQGFVLFRYDSLWKPPAALKDQIDAEINSIKY